MAYSDTWSSTNGFSISLQEIPHREGRDDNLILQRPDPRASPSQSSRGIQSRWKLSTHHRECRYQLDYFIEIIPLEPRDSIFTSSGLPCEAQNRNISNPCLRCQLHECQRPWLSLHAKVVSDPQRMLTTSESRLSGYRTTTRSHFEAKCHPNHPTKE